MSCSHLRIATGLNYWLILEHPCAFRIHKVAYRILGLCLHAYNIMVYVSMTSLIGAVVNNVMLGHVSSIL